MDGPKEKGAVGKWARGISPRTKEGPGLRLGRWNGNVQEAILSPSF